MKKKIGSILLILAMVLTLIPLSKTQVKAATEYWAYTNASLCAQNVSIPTEFKIGDTVPSASNPTARYQAYDMNVTVDNRWYSYQDGSTEGIQLGDKYYKDASGTKYSASYVYYYICTVTYDTTSYGAPNSLTLAVNGHDYEEALYSTGDVDGRTTKYYVLTSLTLAVPVTGVSLDATTASVNVGDTKQLSATISPSDADNTKVTWSSSDETVATVDQDGLVTALKAGSVEITVTTDDGSKTATCNIIVTTPVSGITLDVTEATLSVGGTKTLVATVTPENASEKSVIWSSSDESVATVSADGVVTAKKAGTAKIYAVTKSGSKMKTCTITVSEASSSGSTTSSSTTSEKKYADVTIAEGSVKDITGSAEATAEKNTMSAAIVNNNILEKLVGVTAAEKAEGVNVWLDVVDGSSVVSDSDKAKMEEQSADYTVGMYLDVNLFKKVGSADATKVSKTDGTVQISFVVPESLRASGRSYEIIRVHDGVSSILTGTYDESSYTFTFETDQFSSYAIAYKDGTSVSSPKTGDNTNVWTWLMLVIAGLGLMTASVCHMRKARR